MLNIILPLFLLGSLDLKMWQILIKKTILFKLYTISQFSQYEGSLFEKKKKNPIKVIVVITLRMLLRPLLTTLEHTIFMKTF